MLRLIARWWPLNLMINYSNRTYTFSINHNRSVLLQWILMHYLICKEAQYRFSVSMAEHISVYMNMYNMAVFEGWLAMSLLICMRNQIWSSYSLTNRWIASPENESNYMYETPNFSWNDKQMGLDFRNLYHLLVQNKILGKWTNFYYS